MSATIFPPFGAFPLSAMVTSYHFSYGWLRDLANMSVASQVNQHKYVMCSHGTIIDS